MLKIIDRDHTVAVWQEMLVRKAMIRMQLTSQLAQQLQPEML